MGRKEDHTLARLTPLALCLAGGAFLGQVLASAAPESVAEELRRILSACYQSALSGWRTEDAPSLFRPDTLSAAEIAQIALAYVRCPLFALALGWMGAGAVSLCVLAAAAGFSLSFSIGCFAAAYGKAGIALAAAALGIRSLITLPCFFLLALPFMGVRPPPFLCPPPFLRPLYGLHAPFQQNGFSMAGRKTTAIRRKTPLAKRGLSLAERRLWRRRLETCGAALAAGICAEILVTPRLIQAALSLLYAAQSLPPP